ncbi:MAG: LysR substrate-binding domain-containing protein [Candidatus Obscuribacterales bacterium]|nr:LysR family transcriptional regulator [Cyanobacteria bacterium SZAS LIN-5]RTL42539.1 MAG: LysR family transcriptional regulator [Candidatus Melainabacteria bacterium]
MELRHLGYFVRAAELLHFTRAAESLYISQPTLSVHIQQLEEEFGSPLFARIGRNVRLTEAGQILLDRSRNVIRELELAQQEISSLQGLMRGTLRIGALLAFSLEMVPVWLGVFTKAYPEVHVIVSTGNHHDLERGILDGNFELAFSFLPLESDDLAYTPLFEEDVVMVVSADHPFSKHEHISIRDLEHIPLVLPSRQTNTRRKLDEFLVEYDVHPKIIADVDDLHALLTMVRIGKVGTVLTRMAVAGTRDLATIPFGKASEKLMAVAMWDRRAQTTPAGEAFLEVVKTHCGIEPSKST